MYLNDHLYKFLNKFMQKVGNPFHHPTVIFNKAIAVQARGYSETIGKYFEDYFLWSKIAELAAVENINQVLLKYRVTPGSIMSLIKSPEFDDFMLRVINKGSFTEIDARKMKGVKEKENKENVIEDKDRLYLQRITSTKQKKMNRLFLLLKKLLGKCIAMALTGEIKKVRVYPQMYK